MNWDDYPAPVEDSTTGCQRWQGPLINGYGRISGPTRLAHREAWSTKFGPIPKNMKIDHVWEKGCRYKDCVRIDHLEMISNTENTRRAVAARGGRRSWKDTDHPERAGQGGKSPFQRRKVAGEVKTPALRHPAKPPTPDFWLMHTGRGAWKNLGSESI